VRFADNRFPVGRLSGALPLEEVVGVMDFEKNHKKFTKSDKKYCVDYQYFSDFRQKICQKNRFLLKQFQQKALFLRGILKISHKSHNNNFVFA
jgi:hypothetical protein